MSIETMKQARDFAVEVRQFAVDEKIIGNSKDGDWLSLIAGASEQTIERLEQAIAEAEKQVAFKIYKPTPPRGAIPNVRDAELPWVYDQDPSSGNVASMWVTPVHPHPQPKRDLVCVCGAVWEGDELVESPNTQPKREPLTVEQLREHWQVAKVLDMTNAEIDFADYVLIARDVEALYGIKEDA